jgi:5-methylcytosine-specific restriction endonuclease McrA
MITCYKKRGCRCEKCAETFSAWRRDYYERHREAEIAAAKKYQKENPELVASQWKRYREENRELLNEKAKARYWADPEKHREKAARDRAKDPVGYRAKRRQWRLENLDKYLEVERRSAEKHREKRNAAAREYAKANPENNRRQQHRRRIRLQSGEVFTVLERDLRRLLHRYNHACFYCGGEEGLTLDHVIPVARGEFSRHSIGNLIPACKPCNSSKSDRTIMEWRLGRISPSRVRRRKKAA